VLEAVAILRPHFVQHAPLVEEDAPAIGDADHGPAELQAPAEEPLGFDQLAGARAQVGQELRQVIFDAGGFLRGDARPPVAATEAIAAAAERAIERRGVAIRHRERQSGFGHVVSAPLGVAANLRPITPVANGRRSETGSTGSTTAPAPLPPNRPRTP